MSKAIELLNSLSEEEIALLTAQPSPEGHIIVGGDRFITVPDNLKRLGVQFDHNMETVTFDCPRYWDDRDMSEMAVYINYMLSNGYGDRYPADNVRADGEVMHFEWTISRNVTQVDGSISFLVCVMKTDANGDEERHWNSELNQDCYISKGMESEEHPALKYPDEVTQLLLRMSTVEQINVKAEEMRQLLADTQTAATAAEEAKSLAADEAGYIRNSYANAVKGNVSGEVIRTDDVSPIEHDVFVQVRSKNLLGIANRSIVDFGPYPTNTQRNFTGSGIIVGVAVNNYYNAVNHADLIVTDELVSFTCVASGYGVGFDVPVTPNTTYTLSCESITNGALYVTEYNKNGSWLKYYNHTLPYTFTTGPDTSYILITLRNTGATTAGMSISARYIQLEKGSIRSDYSAFIPPENVAVKASGKNLLPYPYHNGTISVNGATYVDNGDGSIGLSGTPKDYGSMTLYKGPPLVTSGNVVISGIETAENVLLTLNITKEDGEIVSFEITDSMVINTDEYPAATQWNFGIKRWYNDRALLGTVFPQVEIGDVVTVYEPYIPAIVCIPSSDGPCIVKSVSPTMTLLTNTPGIIIEAEYNRDTTKMFESYVLTDKAKQEIANLVDKPAASIRNNMLVIK